MSTYKQLVTASAALVLLILTSAQAATDGEPLDLSVWDDEIKLEDGWRARDLYGIEVMGADDEQIGDIRNIIIGPEGNIKSVIIESGGFLDIGDTHFKVSWQDVTIDDDGKSVSVPINTENVADFSLFDEEPELGPRSWRASELIDDYVSLDDSEAYGIVEDLVFSRDGQLQAVLVRQDLAYDGRVVNRDLYAFPYVGYDRGFEPGAPFYHVPYGRDSLSDREPYDTL